MSRIPLYTIMPCDALPTLTAIYIYTLFHKLARIIIAIASLVRIVCDSIILIDIYKSKRSLRAIGFLAHYYMDVTIILSGGEAALFCGLGSNDYPRGDIRMLSYVPRQTNSSKFLKLVNRCIQLCKLKAR